ncbi:MAG: ABC-2 transporter permease [Firmicutes bacterium]|nr:ABC-2 transporter permease [Bacillota bacterium]
MQTNKPMVGLLTVSFNSSKGNLLIYLAIFLAAVVFVFFTGEIMVYGMLGIVIIVLPVYSLVLQMGAADKWERFQLTMPLRRIDVIKAQFLQVGIVSIAGVPFFIAALAILGTTSHETIPAFTVGLTLSSIASPLFSALLYYAILFPLALTRIAESIISGIAMVGIILVSAAGAAVGYALNWAENTFAIPAVILPVLILVIAYAVFVVSYLITKKMYAKHNF